MSKKGLAYPPSTVILSLSHRIQSLVLASMCPSVDAESGFVGENMSLPPLAPYPSANVQKHIVPEEWELCVDSWLLLTQRYLLQNSAAFEAQIIDDNYLVDFLITYVAAILTAKDVALAVPRSLQRNTFLLIHRALKEVTKVPPALLDWQFLSGLSIAFHKSQGLIDLLPTVWQQHRLDEATSMRKSKSLFTSMMEQPSPAPLLEDRLTREMALSRLCYPYAQFLMVGSDLLDSIMSAYDRITPPSLQTHLVALTYVCFASLMHEENPRTSALLDHLYTLRTSRVVRALIETTPFLVKFRSHIYSHEKDSGRARPLLEQFSMYGNQSRPKSRVGKKLRKGRPKTTSDYGHDAFSGVHVHKMSLVTQVQDLFPDLGSGFIIKLLDEYKEDIELITAHLLDDSLPSHLKQADHSESFDFSNDTQMGGSSNSAPKLSPRNTPPLPPIRRNIYDDDDFDKLTVDASQLHLGRKNKDLTADELLSSERPSNQKAAILSALAAFDTDDDERDDTYDAEDVGGTVDKTFSDEEGDVPGKKNDEALFDAYRMTPELFNRDWNTRRGQPRAALKRETGMTDEAIEGWAIMLSRNPKRLERLERVHETGSGSKQSTLEATSWRADSGTEGGEDSDLGSYWGGSKGRAGRGGSRGRGGRGGAAVAGPANERDTQIARQRKDASKGSRANHNRRDQRARKMARGGLPG